METDQEVFDAVQTDPHPLVGEAVVNDKRVWSRRSLSTDIISLFADTDQEKGKYLGNTYCNCLGCCWNIANALGLARDTDPGALVDRLKELDLLPMDYR